MLTTTTCGCNVLDLNYSYDNASNVIGINTQSYSYDWLNRLTSATGGWGTITYGYDGAGNMLNMTQGGTTTTYSYDSVNRMKTAGSSVTLTYNGNGDLVKEVNGSNTWIYGYDFENRLTGVSLNGHTVQNNTFAGNGNRVMQTANGTSAVYVYQGLNIIYEKNLTSGIATDHYYAGNMQVGAVQKSTAYYFIADLIGSTRVVSSSSGKIIFSSDYKPFGLQYGASGSGVSLLYTGKHYDSATGLYYYNARFYSPSLQRFITEDSDTGSISNPQSLNLYSYALDNPETNNDPTGHQSSVPNFPDYFLNTWIPNNEATFLIAFFSSALALRIGFSRA
ncbi:MAG: RHS repeat-associated core domain-containing protein [Nitrososphaerales archaeon]